VHLRKPLTVGSYTCTLQLKIKTHKCPGAVLPRSLHTCPAYALEGFSKLLIGQLRVQLGDSPFLVRDAHEAKNRIGATRVFGPEIFIRLELKDNFP
jgi:hypothetical protein